MSTPIEKDNITKWILIISSGLFFLAYLSNILYYPIFLDSDYNYGIPMAFIIIIFILIEPFAFYAVIFNFYLTNFHLILWEVWLVPWILILVQSHRKREFWGQKIQISIYIILVFIVLTSAAALELFLVTDDIILKLASQVFWIVPLWLLVWIYGWIIEIPQTLLTTKRINILQAIWVCLFAILSALAINYIGNFFLEVYVYPIF